MPSTLSPAGWLDVLNRRLDDGRRDVQLYDDYDAGRHKLTFATRKFREAFGNLFQAFADNWCPLVIDASVERLKVEGFRFAVAGDADDQAWEIWQANGLDADSKLAHREAVKTGRAYVLVAPPPAPGDYPLITVEHPAQMVVAHAPGNRRARTAALKKWRDDSGYILATLYLPDQIAKFQSQKKIRHYSSSTRIDWQRRVDDPGGPNPLGVVPVLPLYNSPTMLGDGRSDLRDVIPQQDAVNKLISDMLVASEYSAFRQRWATGLEVPTDESDPLRRQMEIQASQSRLISVGDGEVKFGEFGVTELANYVTAIEMLVQHVAAQTRTPPHYLLGQSGTFPSGESLKATETGLVAKARDKQVAFGETWEDVMRLAFRSIGETTKAGIVAAETLWMDPESRTEGELVDSLVKMATLGVPQEELWHRWGVSPTTINRWKELQAQDALRANLGIFDGTGHGAVPQPTAPAPTPPVSRNGGG